MRNLTAISLLAVTVAACSDGTPQQPSIEPDVGLDVEAQPDGDDGSCVGDIDCATGLCLDGVCVDVQCRPNERSCASDQMAVQCNADGQDFTVIDTCADGFRCHRGDCREFVCEPRTVVCEGDAQLVCNDTGTRAQLRSCGGRRICVRGQCLEPQCEDGEVTCQDPRTLRICEEQAYRLQTCSGDEICKDAACEAFWDLAVDHGTASVSRPVEGALALWVVPSGGLPAPELIVWGPVIVEVTAENLTLSVQGQPVVVAERPFEPGVATHLVFTWSVGRAGVWRDGVEVANEAIPATEGGDILELSTGDWRLGSVAIGRAPRGRFTPACEQHGVQNPTVWNLDEGTGERAVANDGTGMSLAGPTWHAGVLPVYGLDEDEDGWGWIHETAPGCQPRDDRYVLSVGDCNDADPGISPSAPEVPDGMDNDCDDEVDE